MAAKRWPLDLRLYCRGMFDGLGAAPKDSQDPNSWRCGSDWVINNTLACQARYGVRCQAGARHARDAQSLDCYDVKELQEVQKARSLGRRVAAYIIRTQPPSVYAPRLSGKSSQNLLIQATANSITA